MASVGPLNLKDITRSALERIVLQLITADEGEEQKILKQLDQEPSDAEKESNDLADLKEEKKGKPSPVSMDDEPTRKRRA
jgi:hypothetical protein